MRYQQLIKLLMLFIFFESFVWLADAQEDCALTLDKAQKLYENGIIEEIPQMLAPCIEHGLSDEGRLRAYKLIILSYLFDQNQEEANKSMLKFLKKYPEYHLATTDPAEFVQLFQLYRSVPIFSIGVTAGGNFSFPLVIKSYVTNSQNLHGKYKNSGIGMQGGITLNFYLATRLELNLEGHYLTNTYKFNLNQPDIENISSTETQNKIEVPVSITYDFGNSRIKPYLRAGASLDYLISATSLKKLFIIPQNQEITGPDINLKARRRQYNYAGIVGGGIKYKIPKGYVFFDIRWKESILNQVAPGDRYNTEETFKYHNPDDDFYLNNLVFSVGYVHSHFKPVKKK